MGSPLAKNIMLQLHETEKIILVIRKHWFVMTGPVLVFFIALAIPPFVLSILPWAAKSFDPELVESITNMLLALYMMCLILFLFFVWTDFYLDMWVVTNERIIDVEQHGLFSREISEIPISRVQDITLEVHGFFETILKFGTIKIRTAGEREFVIHNVPDLYEAKEAILTHAEGRRGGPGPEGRTTGNNRQATG